MIETYRCRGCGYVHIGPAPEICPVCGAPRAFLMPYEVPTGLVGTKTLDNLSAAFAGESQANRRYTLWSHIAELEGASSAVAAFDHSAGEETAHALGHLAYMGGATATAKNLASAIEGEGDESREMYPAMAEEAEAEGFPEIAFYFRALARFEGMHRVAYEKALAELEG